MAHASRSIIAATQPCGHGIDIDTCLFCAEFAAAQVWLSDTERYFHCRLDCDCEARNEDRGRYSKDPNWRKRTEFAKAEREGARPCPQCRPYDPRRWKRKQATSEHIGGLRLTHFTRIENLMSIVAAREIIARGRQESPVFGLGCEDAVAVRAARVVRPPDIVATACVTFSLTHRPGFMAVVRSGEEDSRLLPAQARPAPGGRVALETTFHRLTRRAPDAAPSFRLRWAVASRDLSDPKAGVRHERADLVELIDFARRATGDRFADHPIAQNAEFLVEDGVPFRLIDRMLVPSVALKTAVEHILRDSKIPDPPDVRVRSHWFE